MPTFWVAMILIMFFVYQLKIFPSAGMHSVLRLRESCILSICCAYDLAAFDMV
jgi:ABC-type dipeptide/oligopeptide/nickel transport system permease component